MINRFAPDWNKVEPVYNQVAIHVKGSEHLLTEAFSTAFTSKQKTLSYSDVKRSLRAAVGMSTGMPWVLYDTLSGLMNLLPLGARPPLGRLIRIETGYKYEYLQISPTNGHWQIAWEADPTADPEYREVILDWYAPLNHEQAPLVPSAIIDCIAGCVSLLREGLVLPAAAVLSIALESTLWDALSESGISRYSDQVTFAPARWNVRKTGGSNLIVTIEGADRDLRDLGTITGNYPTVVTFETRRTPTSANHRKIALKLDLDTQLCEFFASSQIEKSEKVADYGLSAAIQFARGNDIPSIRIILKALDKTLIALRNNLVHLPSDGRLHEPVPIPSQGDLLTVDDLRSNPKLFQELLRLVIEFINAVYAGQVEPDNVADSIHAQ